MKDWFKLARDYSSGPTINKCSWPVIVRNMVSGIFVIMPSVVYSKRDGIYICIYIIFIGVQLLYNVVLVSAVQKNESALCTHIPPLCHHRALSRVPCATQQVLSRYIHIAVYIRQSQSFNSAYPAFPHLVSSCLFSVSMSLFLLCNKQTNKQTREITQKLEANPFKWACLNMGLQL